MCNYNGIGLFECPIRTLWTFYIDTGEPHSVSFTIEGEATIEDHYDPDYTYIAEYELWMSDGENDWVHPTLLYLEFRPAEGNRVKVFEGENEYSTEFKGEINVSEIESYVRKRVKEIVERFKSMSFEEFKKWIKENYYDWEKAWFYENEEDARDAGSGVISMAKMVASEDILPDGWDYMDVIDRILFP